MVFADRSDAGRRLAAALSQFREKSPVIIALPRGGVPVAAEVAAALSAPLDLAIVRKIGVPMQPELAMGAVADAMPPVVIRNEEVIRAAGVSQATFDAEYERQLTEARRRRSLYLADRRPVPLAGRTAIVIDDGIATGASMRAALRSVRAGHPRRVVLAVPVATRGTLDSLRSETDDIVCLDPRDGLDAVGEFYRDFAQVQDQEVVRAMRQFSEAFPWPADTPPPSESAS
jgi:predicted phosphoribosyltransferase